MTTTTAAGRWTLVLALLGALAGGCAGATDPVEGPRAARGGGDAAPAWEQVAQAGFAGVTEPGFPPDRAVPLAGGRWEGEPFAPGAASRPQAVLLRNATATGDLDGDGAAERAVLLSASSGGSGERIWLGAFGLRDGQVEQRGAVLVGDRSRIRAIAVQDGRVRLDVVEVGDGEPACCGTQLARLVYALEDGALVRKEHVVQGSLSAATLEGTTWRLVELDDEPLAAGTQAPDLRIEGGRAAGFGGCNRYGGAMGGTAPGELGPLPHRFMSTMMACPGPQMDLERAFLRALSRAARYGFTDGRLVLYWTDGEARGRLVFDPVP